MKIIIVNYRYFISGGPEKYMFNVMNLLEKHGHEVFPFSVNYDRNVESKYSRYFVNPIGGKDSVNFDEYNKSIFTKIRLSLRTFYNRKAKVKLVKMIKDIKPDIIYVLHHINVLTPSVFKAAKKMKVPVIHRISDYYLLCGKYNLLRDGKICTLCIDKSRTNMIRHKCLKNSLTASTIRYLSMGFHDILKLYNNVDYFIATNDFAKNLFVDSRKIASNKILTIPTFINCEDIQPEYNHKNYALLLGRMSVEKGFIYAIDAMTYLMDLDIKLYITGEPTEDIMNKIKHDGLSEKVVFTGFLIGEPLEQVIKSSSMIIAPAIWYENLPNAVIEAFAYGKPVVASNIGSLKEMIDNGINGLLFNTADSYDLSKKIRKLYTNKEFLTEVSLGARKTAETKYSASSHIESLSMLFEKTIKEKRK